MHALEDEMMAIPARTAEELAAKIVTNTAEGDFEMEGVMLTECRALAGSAS